MIPWKTWQRQLMKHISYHWLFVREIGGTPPKRASNVELYCLLCCYCEPALHKQWLPVIKDVMALMNHYCNAHLGSHRYAIKPNSQISQCTCPVYRNTPHFCSKVSGALWDMWQMPCGICAVGQFLVTPLRPSYVDRFSEVGHHWLMQPLVCSWGTLPEQILI